MMQNRFVQILIVIFFLLVNGVRRPPCREGLYE